MGYEWGKAQPFPANLLGLTNQLLVVGKSVGYIFGEPRKICERIAADGIHYPNLNFSWVTPPISMGSIPVFGGSIPVFLGLNPIFFGQQKLLWPHLWEGKHQAHCGAELRQGAGCSPRSDDTGGHSRAGLGV